MGPNVRPKGCGQCPHLSGVASWLEAGNRLAAEALAILERDSAGAGSAFFYQAIARLPCQRHRGSVESCRAALDVYTKLGDAAGRSRAVGMLGMAAVWAHCNEEAIGILHEAVDLAVDVWDLWAQGQILTYMGLADLIWAAPSWPGQGFSKEWTPSPVWATFQTAGSRSRALRR